MYTAAEKCDRLLSASTYVTEIPAEERKNILKV